jgi:phosphatidylethanolamine/phosphatidyl-N-methylethanolamine N-methyltransferase
VTINTNRWNRLRYTFYAPFYDRVATFRRQRRRSIGLLNLRPRERVLVDGAGTGRDLDFIPDGVDVVATDLTPAMVERIRTRAIRLGRHVDARVMDAHALDFPDASFDAEILHLIIAVVPDPARALREAARVLRPGGRVVIFDKFVPEGRPPSVLRRGLNVVSNVLFTDVTRQLGALLEGTGLRVVHREPALLGRSFEIVLLTK